MCGSPKGARKSGGLDFEAEGRQEDVQNASRRTRAEDQTSQDQTSHLCKKYIKSHKPLALKLTLSRIIQVSNNLHFYERRGVIIMKYMDKDDFEKQNVFGTGQANSAYAKYFIGDSFLNPLTDPKCGLFLANVTCSNEWCEPVTDEEYNKLG